MCMRACVCVCVPLVEVPLSAVSEMWWKLTADWLASFHLFDSLLRAVVTQFIADSGDTVYCHASGTADSGNLPPLRKKSTESFDCRLEHQRIPWDPSDHDARIEIKQGTQTARRKLMWAKIACCFHIKNGND